MLRGESFDLRILLQGRKLISQRRAFVPNITMSNDDSLATAFLGLDHHDLAAVGFLTNYRGQFAQQ